MRLRAVGLAVFSMYVLNCCLAEGGQILNNMNVNSPSIRIIHSAEADWEIKQAASALQKAFFNKTGSQPKLLPDTTVPEENEILIKIVRENI